MNVNRLRGLFAAALVVVSFFTACGPQETSSEEVPPSALTQEIGPEGGELVAPDDSPLAGVRVKVPPGALSAKVKLTVDGTLDPTPLSSAAEQVGPQIAIGPAGTTFATPVELTVPLDARSVARHEQSSEDCKVWHRTDGNWQRLERKAGAPGSITVDLPSAGVAAAGVLSRTGSLTCLTNPTLCRLVPVKGTLTGCSDPSGFCFEKLPQPTYAPLGQYPEFAVVNRKLYYAHSPGAEKISVARYDLVTGASVLLGTLTLPGLSLTADSPIAVEADGSAWLGLRRFGNAKFKEGQLPLRFDFGLENGREKRGEGAVIVGDKTIRLFAVRNDLFLTDGTPTRHAFPAPSFLTDFSLLPAKGVPGKFVAWNTNAVLRLGFGDTTAETAMQIDGDSFEVTASSKSSGVASAFNGESVPDGVKWQTAANGLHDFASVNRMAALDGNDNLYAATTLVPEVRFFTEQGGFGVIPLTSAASGTNDFNRMQPRALVGVPGRREVVVVVRGSDTTVPQGVREFWLLQQAD